MTALDELMNSEKWNALCTCEVTPQGNISQWDEACKIHGIAAANDRQNKRMQELEDTPPWGEDD